MSVRPGAVDTPTPGRWCPRCHPVTAVSASAFHRRPRHIRMASNKDGYAETVDYDETLDTHPTDEELDAAVESLEASGFDVVVVEDRAAALDELTAQIPADAGVMDGHSTTLEEIGFMDHLMESDHDWE